MVHYYMPNFYDAKIAQRRVHQPYATPGPTQRFQNLQIPPTNIQPAKPGCASEVDHGYLDGSSWGYSLGYIDGQRDCISSGRAFLNPDVRERSKHMRGL